MDYTLCRGCRTFFLFLPSIYLYMNQIWSSIFCSLFVANCSKVSKNKIIIVVSSILPNFVAVMMRCIKELKKILGQCTAEGILIMFVFLFFVYILVFHFAIFVAVVDMFHGFEEDVDDLWIFFMVFLSSSQFFLIYPWLQL